MFALGPDKLEYLLFIETCSWACYRSSALTPVVERLPEVAAHSSPPWPLLPHAGERVLREVIEPKSCNEV